VLNKKLAETASNCLVDFFHTKPEWQRHLQRTFSYKIKHPIGLPNYFREKYLKKGLKND
jgi:hypothetical protein